MVILVAGACIATYFLMGQKGDQPASSNSSNGLEIEENAQMGIMPGIDLEERQKQLQEELDNSMIAFSVNTNPVFEDKEAEGNLMIENPVHNAKLLVAEIILEETNEIIYTSKALLPGSYLENVKLDKPLEKGKYEALVELKAYSEETKELIGQTAAGITITVLN